MTRLLRFIFARRFNRLDLLACSVAAAAFAHGDWIAGLVLLIPFAFASVIGELWLERRL